MVAVMLGKPLMRWQQEVADVICEIDPETGELAYDEWIVLTPRQSGKSTFILAKSTHRASATKFFGPRQRIVYTAQTRQKAREKWDEDFVPDLLHSRRLRGKVSASKQSGNEHTRFTNGSRFGIEANTEKAGHGGTLDEAYIDEAFSQVDNRLEQAFGPAMITRRNKQLGIISTAGWLDASPYLLAKVRMGRELVREDVRRGTAYFEFSAPDDADPSDINVWYSCMPALHRPECEPGCKAHTIRLTAIQSEYDKAKRSGKLSDFKRAYLNQWVLKPKEAEETALGNWSACSAVLDVEPTPAAIGVAVSRDLQFGSIGAAAPLDDDRVLVAAVDRREGIAWLQAEVLRIQQTYSCAVVIDEKGPAGFLIESFEEAGIKVTRAKLSDYLDGCSGITDDVRTRKLVHLNHPDLDDAVKGARWRDVGESRRAFGRKVSESDVAMLEAVTLARWAISHDRDYDILDSIG